MKHTPLPGKKTRKATRLTSAVVRRSEAFPPFLVLALLAGSLALAAVSEARAHLLNMSRVTTSFHEDGRVHVDLALDLLLTLGSREAYYDASLLARPLRDPALSTLLAPLAGAVELTVDGTPVQLQLKTLEFEDETREAYLDPLNWPRAGLRLEGRLPDRRAARAIARVRYSEAFRFEEPIANTFSDLASGRTQTRWLVTGQRSPDFRLQVQGATDVESSPQVPPTGDSQSEALAVFHSLLVAGVRHIVPDGIDHLLFVAALLFGSAALTQLVAVITVFTLAHSLSLAMTALGWIAAPVSIVEPLILLSIGWVAISALRGRSRQHESYLLVLLFGLVHGMGFAVALRELGLPPDYLLAGLAGFNVGVEVAQLAVVALLALGLRALGLHYGPEARWRRRGLLGVIGATGVLILLRIA